MAEDKTSFTLENALRFTFHPHGARDFYEEMYGKDDQKLIKLAKTFDVVKYVIPTVAVASYVAKNYIL